MLGARRTAAAVRRNGRTAANQALRKLGLAQVPYLERVGDKALHVLLQAIDGLHVEEPHHGSFVVQDLLGPLVDLGPLGLIPVVRPSRIK